MEEKKSFFTIHRDLADLINELELSCIIDATSRATDASLSMENIKCPNSKSISLNFILT